MKIFDTHCHLDDKVYRKDLDRIIKRAYSNDVCGFMTVGTDKKTSSRAVDIANSIPCCYASVGFHPHDAKECTNNEIDFLADLAKNNEKVKAWGEIGLDFNRMFSPKEEQERQFIKQLEKALSLRLPIIFHERDSRGRFYEILKEYAKKGIKGVIHCFSGDKNDLTKYLDLDLYIGITGIITIKGRGENLRRLAPSIPKNRIVIETDAPYLTPAPQKNKTRRNEPAFVKEVLISLSNILNIIPEDLGKILWENSIRLFELDPVSE